MFKKLLLIFSITVLMIPMMTVNVHGASSINISGKSQINQGDTMTVTVTFSGEDVGRVDGQLTYDSSVLSYISGGTSNGDNGYIELKDAGTGEPLKFNIKFKGVGDGSTSLKVTANGVYNLEEELIDSPSASKQVTVIGSTTETTTEETSETTEITESTEITTSESDTDNNGSVFNLKKMIVIPLILVIIAIIAISAILFVKKGKKGKHSKR